MPGLKRNEVEWWRYRAGAGRPRENFIKTENYLRRRAKQV